MTKLFEDYRSEYIRGRLGHPDGDGDTKRRRVQPGDDQGPSGHDVASSSSVPPSAVEADEMDVNEVNFDCGEYLDGWGEFAIDDITGAQLSLDLVRAARREEMHNMLSRTVKIVKTAEAYEKTVKGPISTKWVDVDKSHGVGEMLVWSRWVARDFKEKGEKDREDLFSATPPLELMRYMLSWQATIRDDGPERKTMYLDVKKAHLIPKCDQDVYVQLPPEAGAQPDECGKLLFWLYGCRPAAQAWEEHYSAVLSKAGFKRLASCPVAFAHESRDLMGVVHGDDFVFVGLDVDLDYSLGILQANCELKNSAAATKMQKRSTCSAESCDGTIGA